jgi:trigger factor
MHPVKVTTTELERCEVLLTIEFEPQKEQDLLKQAAKRIARKVRIPGFRPGKAPFNTIIRRFGIEAVQQEALEDIDKLIKNAVGETDLQPFAQMQLEDVGWDPLTIKLNVPTQPKVELGDYRDLRLEWEPVEVTDEDVEKTLKAVQDQNATWTPVERPSQIGDLISMIVTEKDGDQVLVEEESAEYELTPLEEADKGKQPDLTTPLLGLSAGDSKTFTITYPEDFNNDQYAGKEITFNVEVSGVKIKELDPLDDEFAQQVGDFETLAELKEDIYNTLKKQRQQQRDSELGAELLGKIIEGVEKLDWPLALEEEALDDEIKRSERQLKNMGLTIDSYLQMQNKTKDEWREELRPRIVDRLKRGLVLGKVAELEGLQVSQSEILQQAKVLADYSGGGDQLWRSILSSQAQQGAIANDVLSSKALMRLAAIAKGEAPEPDSESPAEEEADDLDSKAGEVSATTEAAASESTSAEPAQASPDTAETETEVTEKA